MTNAKASSQTYDNCFKKALVTYAAFIDSEITEDNPSIKYQKGQKIRAQLKREFRPQLIYSCNAFYNSAEDERQRLLTRGRAKAYKSEIEKLNERVALHPVSENYFQRGLKHFMLTNFKEAEADLRKSIEINPNTARGIYTKREHAVLAWLLEEQGKYRESLEVLNKIKVSIYDKEIPIIKAIVNRKAGGLKPAKTEKIVVDKNSGKKAQSQRLNRNKKSEEAKKKTSETELRSLFKLNKKKKTTKGNNN